MSTRPALSVDKLLWVKFGWSEYYRGGPVDGNFSYMRQGGKGHEAWNFQQADDGNYYCYIPPQGRGGSPRNNDPYGWTVVCLARFPGRTGIHVVGWYEDATLDQGSRAWPGPRTDAAASLEYGIKAPIAYLVPPESRTNPFSHSSVRQGKYSFLCGPGVSANPNRLEVRRILERELARLRPVAVGQPSPATVPDTLNDETDPLRGFGTAAHRKNVEKAAIRATKKQLAAMGYSCKSREKENVGFDLEATGQALPDPLLHVEVKGTASATPQFFMTANEHAYMTRKEWRLAMVTDALGRADVELFELNEVRQRFDIQPMVWVGRNMEQD